MRTQAKNTDWENELLLLGTGKMNSKTVTFL